MERNAQPDRKQTGLATPTRSTRKQTQVLLVLILCGECIFSLPFHIGRYFRPLLLDVLELTNTELGDAFALYGVVAMASYFPGGLIADRFSSRHLITLSMWATAAGGCVLLTLPEPGLLAGLYAFWGLTTILLFWAALFKCVRILGSETQAGRLGVLDGGRGAVSAALATLATLIFGVTGADGIDGGGTTAIATQSFRAICGFYMVATSLGGLLAFRVLANFEQDATERGTCVVAETYAPGALIRSHGLIWQAIIVLTAYTVFKSLDYLSLYLTDVRGQTSFEASQTVTALAWLRPVGAIAAGLLADRLSPSRVCLGLFIVLVLTFALLAGGAFVYLPFLPQGTAVIAMLGAGALCTYGLRGIYFALISETGAPRAAAGTAVGLISAVGFLPEIYVGSGAGRLLDAIPGENGFRIFFACLAANCLLGAIAAYRLRKHIGKD